MKTSFALASFAVIAVVMLSGCYYDNEEYLYGAGCTTADLTYSTGVKAILELNCSGSACHGQGGDNGELITYEQVKAKADDGRLRGVLLTSKSMPPSGSLSSCELEVVRQWLDAGAPNN
jgi:hypothetical protein